jgi:hypothetical protein
MTTFTSTLSHSGAIPFSQSRKIGLPKKLPASRKAARTDAMTQLFRSLEKASSENPEKFYQDHTIAIYMCIYMETTIGPLLGAIVVYLYGHWMM